MNHLCPQQSYMKKCIEKWRTIGWRHSSTSYVIFIYVNNLDKTLFFYCRPDFQKLQFDIGLLTPRFSYTSKYSLSQKFNGLNVHVRGDGDMNGVFGKQIHAKLRNLVRWIGQLIQLVKIGFYYADKIERSQHNAM